MRDIKWEDWSTSDAGGWSNGRGRLSQVEIARTPFWTYWIFRSHAGYDVCVLSMGTWITLGEIQSSLESARAVAQSHLDARLTSWENAA